jgi:LysR family transcriptional regulator for bpeEF and oprC
MANDIIMPALPGFFERYPDIRLDLGCGDRPVDLIEEGVDCAIRAGNLPDSALIARRIGVLNFLTCATPAYLARHGRPQHPRELSEHLCINYFSSRTGKSFEWDFARGDEKISIAVPARLAINDSSVYSSAGLLGLGVLHMASYRAEALIASGQMEALLQDWSCEALPINVVYPQNRHLSAKVRVFVEWVAELFVSHPSLQLTRN